MSDSLTTKYIEIQNVEQTFKTKKGPFCALKNINLTVAKGEFVALIGHSGCGKSTLLRMLAGFEKPTSGTVLLDGVDIASFPPYERPINMMFQSYALFPHLNIWDNIAFGLKREGMPKAQLEARVTEMLKLTQLEAFARRKPHQLSGGQPQRVAICRALVQRPQIILADEPIASLDPRNTQMVMDALRSINQEMGITVLCNLHALDIARDYCGRLVGMSAGKVVFDGVPDQLTEDAVGNLYGIEASEALQKSPKLNLQSAQILPMSVAAQVH